MVPTPHLPVRVAAPDNLSPAGSISTRLRHVLQRGVSGVRLVYANWSNQGGRDVPGPDAITISARLEAASTHVVTFGGSARVRLRPGETCISDRVEFSAGRGSSFHSVTSVVAEPGGLIPLGPQPNAVDGEVVESPTQTDSGHGYGPWQILAEADTGAPMVPTLLVTGDSNAVGFGDTRGTACHYGWVRRALESRFPTVNLAVSGATARGALDSSSRIRRDALLRWVSPTWAIAALGTNDLQQGGPTLVEMQEVLQRHWSDLGGLGVQVVGCTIPPVTVSVDGWRTANGQQPTPGAAERDALNAWIRSRPAPLAATLDLAAALCDPASPQRWRPGLTDDGLHPNRRGHATVARAVLSSQAMADLGRRAAGI
ncbi:SGNH/GDSL hydrolase family protein [Tessaracoccus lubricantis]|uniref:SGNH/GDSL hydrolase family protein n=1 Tax=Tessaracoccus lubricantis TaxID=545543 RepID=A0ABP9FH99_9ACTN